MVLLNVTHYESETINKIVQHCAKICIWHEYFHGISFFAVLINILNTVYSKGKALTSVVVKI